MTTPLKRISTRLAELLKNHDKTGARARRLTFDSLPLATCVKFEGEPLRHVMSPPVPVTGPETEALFDAWLYPLHTGEGEPEKESVGETLFNFMNKGETLGDKTVRLLYALGNAEGAVLTYDQHTVKVQHDDRVFGISNGVVFSKFCSGLHIPAEPQRVLEESGKVRTFDKFFCSLYREACKVGKGTKEALIALHTGKPGESMRRMVRIENTAKLPTSRQMSVFEETLHKPLDPLAYLYKQLVPGFLKPAEFSKLFGTLGQRPETLSATARQKHINTLHTHFHKTKKKAQK